ncbi:hypothetical protein D1816_04430 [Aquimarina sp. AD10]|uniref:nuclear transport factor 2 family protein n=1 Tax=Aquimarina sp. AD10 TaxID=1714849 RepID=UPI000E46C755|nr:nuclear transport factor 2 family protein [Aquimarina sp. AD10]AXT59632.1 hypothetical protein D1816_04430 [Aquimarina sp. AD10]RKM94686.1 hypothetical protein D7033_17755 [Aquimarina sp. AD10]
MKKTIFTVLLFIFGTIATYAQTPEHDQVKATVSYYLEGGTNNDFETLKKAFHKDATMKFISNAGYKEVNALEFFKKVIKPGPKQNRKTKVVSIDVEGTSAQAKLRIDYDTFAFIDFMNLLKIDGEWKIVNKIFYRSKK